MNIEIPDVPEGYVYDGIRKASNYEYYYNGEKWVSVGYGFTGGSYPVAIKKPEEKAELPETLIMGILPVYECESCRNLLLMVEKLRNDLNAVIQWGAELEARLIEKEKK
jgi:hypothetical protein